MSTDKILLSSPTMHGEEMMYIKEAFDTNWVAPLGRNCDMFESAMSEYLKGDDGIKQHCVCLSSGTSSLHLALKLAGVKSGERVFCSDMTFAATANPITYEGGIPVFIDSEYETWNICPKALEKAFEKYPDTRVVMIAHLYGTPSKLDEILEVCKKYNAVLIEDAAEALSAEYKGKKCGTFGEYNVFSFNGNKIITSSGGGMLICLDKAKRDKALFWATQSKEPEIWYEHNEIGYNYRMSNISAGIGRGQMIHLEEHRAKKEAIYKKYKEAFSDLPLRMNPYLEDSKPNFWLSCILLDDECDVEPISIFKVLKENNIESRPIWKPMHLQPVYANNDFISFEESPVNEKVFAKGLCLPSDIKMTEEQQDFVISIVKSCFGV